jgi:hypothetical protein
MVRVIICLHRSTFINPLLKSSDITHANLRLNDICRAESASPTLCLFISLKTHSSSIVLRAVGGDVFSDLQTSGVVGVPLCASNRSKIVTRSFEAVESTPLIMGGIAHSLM